MAGKRKQSKQEKEGVIRDNEVVTLDEFKARMGLADWAWRKARQEADNYGITLSVQQGKRVYVSGKLWHQFLLKKCGAA